MALIWISLAASVKCNSALFVFAFVCHPTYRTNRTTFWSLSPQWSYSSGWCRRWHRTRNPLAVAPNAGAKTRSRLSTSWSSRPRSWTSARLSARSKDPKVIRSGEPWEKGMEPKSEPGRKARQFFPWTLSHPAMHRCNLARFSEFLDELPASPQPGSTTRRRKRRSLKPGCRIPTASRGSRWSARASPTWSLFPKPRREAPTRIFLFLLSAPTARPDYATPEKPSPKSEN